MRILQSIEKNSLRFYNESFEAFFKKKYATAIFLAIFSIEEAAKYVIVEKENSIVDPENETVC
jgi:AbiV family abortive infection protein